jgi:hypothetical protein
MVKTKNWVVPVVPISVLIAVIAGLAGFSHVADPAECRDLRVNHLYTEAVVAVENPSGSKSWRILVLGAGWCGGRGPVSPQVGRDP